MEVDQTNKFNEITKPELKLEENFKTNFNHIFNTNILPNGDLKSSSISTWILNEYVLPIIKSAPIPDECDFKSKFLGLENYETLFENLKHSPLNLTDYSILNIWPELISNESTLKQNFKIEDLHVHIYYCINQTATVSVPMVIYPKTDLLDQASNCDLIKRTVSIEHTSNGDLNSLSSFLNWLQLFSQQLDCLNLNQTVILANWNIYSKLCGLNTNCDVYSKLKQFLKEKNIFLLFYPHFEFNSDLNQKLFVELKQNLSKNLNEFSLRNNPNNETALLYILKQSLRDLAQAKNKLLITQVFNQIFSYFNLKTMPSEVLEFENESLNENKYKLSEQEVQEYCEWIDLMSQTNNLVIKQAFLRDLGEKLTNKESIAHEKRWTEFLAKNKSKFKYKDSIGILAEKDYHLKCMDLDACKLKYYDLVVNNLKLNGPEAIWTVDMFHFAYNLNSNLVQLPCKMSNSNSKPRISVLFGYNACGDYLQPYFVYPFEFQDSQLGSNECLSKNGIVTSRIFENWLFNLFLPYVQGKSSKILLLFCAKLTLVDKKLIQTIKNSKNLEINLNFFGLTQENLKPFNYLFKKNLRKRQTDVFLDSWRRTTAKKTNSSTQFKCNSRQLFFNVFMDVFQNCIEEIGNTDDPDDENDLNRTSVSYFSNKMKSTFEICELWPIQPVDSKPKRQLEEEDKKFEKVKKINVNNFEDRNLRKNGNKVNSRCNKSLKEFGENKIENLSDLLRKNEKLASIAKNMIKDELKKVVIKRPANNNHLETKENKNLKNLVKDLIILLLERKDKSENVKENQLNILDIEHKFKTIFKENKESKVNNIRSLIGSLNIGSATNDCVDKLSDLLCDFYLI